MKKKYTFKKKFVSFAFLIIIFLQSCNTDNDQSLIEQDDLTGKGPLKQIEDITTKLLEYEVADNNDQNSIINSSSELSADYSSDTSEYSSELFSQIKDVGQVRGSSPQEIAVWEKLNFITFLPSILKDEIKYCKLLGAGGFGSVYQANYKGKTVAVKKLKNPSKEQIASFQKEAVIMANHRHKNIVTFLGFCSEENALMMEYVPGNSLSSLLKSDEDITWQLRYQIALDVAEGMNYLHDCGVVHADLKSENILLDSRKRAKVTDFGMSGLKTESTNSSYYNFGPWQGTTWRWTAPEITNKIANRRAKIQKKIRKNKTIDLERMPIIKNTKAADVYSYGMLLWQLGSRKEPFESFKIYDQLEAYYMNPNNREQITEDTPLEIKEIIQSCWLPELDRINLKQVRHMLEDIDSTLLENDNQQTDYNINKEKKNKGKEKEPIRQVKEDIAGSKKKKKRLSEDKEVSEILYFNLAELNLNKDKELYSKEEKEIGESNSSFSFLHHTADKVKGFKQFIAPGRKAVNRLVNQACEQASTTNGKVRLLHARWTDQVLVEIIKALNNPSLPPIIELDLSDNNLLDINLSCLGKLTSLNSLNLSNTQLNIKSLRAVNKANLKLDVLIIRQNPALLSVADEDLIFYTEQYVSTYFDASLHYRLGKYYERQGEEAKAAKLYKECEDCSTQLAVAELYLRKTANSPDFNQGFKIIQNLSRKGYKEAQYILGRFYEKADSEVYAYMVTNQLIPEGASELETEQLRLRKAEHWYKLAAKQLHKSAAMSLGQLYERGKIKVAIPSGQPQDERHQLMAALKYYQFAKEAGSTSVDRNIEQLEKKLEDII